MAGGRDELAGRRHMEIASPLKRCPFTLLMLVVLVGAGIYGQSHVGLLDAELHHQVGHSPRLLFGGHWHRLLTSLVFTAGGWRFYSSLALLATAVGCVEFVYGTRRAMLTFFGIHFATLLFVAGAIAWPLSMLETLHGELLFDARDVGPSAGYYGCLGLFVAGLSSRKREAIVAAIALLLILRLISSSLQLAEEGRVMSADLAHLVAFPLGVLSPRLLRNSGAQENDPHLSQPAAQAASRGTDKTPGNVPNEIDEDRG
jgi:hypothetical protein